MPTRTMINIIPTTKRLTTAGTTPKHAPTLFSEPIRNLKTKESYSHQFEQFTGRIIMLLTRNRKLITCATVFLVFAFYSPLVFCRDSHHASSPDLHGSPTFIAEMVYDEDTRCVRIRRRLIKCGMCKEIFTPRNPGHKYCSETCWSRRMAIYISRLQKKCEKYWKNGNYNKPLPSDLNEKITRLPVPNWENYFPRVHLKKECLKYWLNDKRLPIIAADLYDGSSFIGKIIKIPNWKTYFPRVHSFVKHVLGQDVAARRESRQDVVPAKVEPRKVVSRRVYV